LIQAGIYSVVRHPLHLGLIIQIVGLTLLGPLLVLIPLTIALTAVLIRRNRIEDEVLLKVFGAEAAEYQKRVVSMNPFSPLILGCGNMIERRTCTMNRPASTGASSGSLKRRFKIN
jgi:hypothetical protein